ncbi:MAG: hypothetical protein AABX74_04150, partial [Nanoarchaeota archaeon]
NSLLECLVFSAKAAEKAKTHNNKKIRPYNYNKYKIIRLNKNKEKELVEMQGKIKEIMWNKVGIIRTKKGLKEALMEIKKLEQELKDNYDGDIINKTIIETKSMIAVAKLIIEASLRRNKSVGCFYLVE